MSGRKLTRRAALTAAAISAASCRRLLGANDRVQVGFVGYGLIGNQHVHDFKNQKARRCVLLLTLFVVPVTYSMVEGLRERWGRRAVAPAMGD
jgi:hypothetical protein